MRKLFLLLLLTSCSPSVINKYSNNMFIDLDKNLSFNEYKIYFEKYNKNKSYPDIDK